MVRHGTWKRLLMVAAGITALSVLAACGGGDASVSDKPVTPKNGSTVNARVGKDLVVRLASNPTTGYSWSVKNTGAGVKFVSSSYEAPKNNAAGAPGQQLLTFTPTKTGTWKVGLKYERPFAPGEPGKSLTFSVDASKP
ncbi:MAG: protease inhibitor I42 family protein [Acidimicrobiia bacterium]